DILRGLAWDAVSAIPALTEGCRDENEQVRAYCAHALVEIAEAVHARVPLALPMLAASVPVLTGALSDKSAEVRCLAVQALGAIGEAAIPAMPKILELLNEDDEELQTAIKFALKQIKTSDK